MAPNQIKHIRLIGRIGLISLIVNIGFIGMALAPLPAQAQCCLCYLGDDVIACYDGSKINEVDCEKTNKVKELQNGTQVGCRYYKETTCANTSANNQLCPDMTSFSALSGILAKSLGVKLEEREPLCFKPSVSIPGTDFLVGARDPECPGGGIKIDATLLAKYIAGIYYFIISSIGILAVVGIMIGGFQYLMAAGSPEKISSAKTSITSAIIGLIIGLTSYLLFSTINPDIVNLRTSGLASVAELNRQAFKAAEGSKEGQQQLFDQSCENPALVDAREGGLDPIFQITASDTRMHEKTEQALKAVAASNERLAVEVLKDGKVETQNLTFKDWVKAIGANSMTITSAYRSIEKQHELKNCYEYSRKDTGTCPYHCSSCNKAASANCNAPHVSGYAVDVCIQTKDDTKNNARCDWVKDHLESADVGKSAYAGCSTNFPGCNGVKIVLSVSSVGFMSSAQFAPDNQQILQRYFEAAKFRLLKCEWWHFEAPGYSGRVGRYRTSESGYTSCTPTENSTE